MKQFITWTGRRMRIGFGNARRASVLAMLACSWSLPVEAQQPQPPAQQQKKVPVITPEMKEADKLEAELRGLRTRIAPMLQSGDIKDRVDFEKYLALRIELFKAKGMATELPNQRDDVRKELRRMGVAPDKKGLQFYTTFMLQQCDELCFDQPIDKYSAATRYNAMLMIGELNSVEPNMVAFVPGSGGAAVPPTPMPEALPVMLRALKEPDIMDCVRFGAVVGLLRHAELGIADKAMEKQVLVEMLALLDQKQEPSYRTEAAQVWLRRRAADIIGQMRRNGVNTGGNDAVAALEKVLLDEESPLPLRFDCARALGQFSYTAPPPPATLVPSLANLALTVAEAEQNKRSLKHGLRAVKVALNGLETQPANQPKRGIIHYLPATQKQFADELLARVQTIWQLCDKTVDEAVLAEKVKTEATKLKDFVDKGVNPPAAAQAGGK